MTRKVIVILGEGRHEVGVGDDTLEPGEPLPALPALVHALMGAPEDVTYKTGLFRHVVHARGRGYDKKIRLAMRKARDEGAAGLAVVVDRDGRQNASRLADLQRGRNEFPPTLGVSCAVGVAVEAFDAWVIADGQAMSAAAGTKAQAHGDPETLSPGEAKRYAAGQLADGDAARYAEVARQADLDLLRRKCPKGFAPFAQEVEQYLAPGVRPPIGAGGHA